MAEGKGQVRVRVSSHRLTTVEQHTIMHHLVYAGVVRHTERLSTKGPCRSVADDQVHSFMSTVDLLLVHRVTKGFTVTVTRPQFNRAPLGTGGLGGLGSGSGLGSQFNRAPLGPGVLGGGR